MSRPRKNLKGTTVTVTARDIARATRTGTNPVEIATRRAISRASYVYAVGLEVEYAGGEVVLYALPKRALRLAQKFNENDSKLKPLTFTIGRRALLAA